MATANVPHEFSVGDLVHYTVGSDRYPARVTKVTPSGKSVWIVPVDWMRRPDFEPAQCMGHMWSEDEVIMLPQERGATPEKFALTMRKRGGLRWRCGSRHLQKGFCYYQNPSY